MQYDDNNSKKVITDLEPPQTGDWYFITLTYFKNNGSEMELTNSRLYSIIDTLNNSITMIFPNQIRSVFYSTFKFIVWMILQLNSRYRRIDTLVMH